MPQVDPGPEGVANTGPDQVLIVGCGASLRCDDQVGLRVAEAISRAQLPPQVRVKTSESPCADLLAELASERDVGLFVIIDAAAPELGRPPGTWCRLDYRHQPQHIRTGDRSSLHGLGVDAAFEIAAEMGMLPPSVWVYVVATAEVGYGEEMTPAVSAVIGELNERIAADVKAWLGERTGKRA